jgi:hypothetical protein
VVTKKKNSLSKSSSDRVLSQIKDEMAKPRVTASARAPITHPKVLFVPGRSLTQGPAKLFQLQEIGVPVANNSVERLKLMSRRLQLLADKHSSVTEALLSISGSILGIATVLRVLVISKASTRPV